MSDWMMTYTGRRVFPLDVKPEDVDIRDIAHALSLQCRYNGHVQRFYSVAEHCVHISATVFLQTGDRVAALQGLIHDAAETYTGDLIRPMKNSLKYKWPDFKDIESRNERAICAALGLPTEFHPFVDEYDKRIIADEKEALFGANKPWDWDFEPLGVVIRGWQPDYAEERYLEQYGRLTGNYLAWMEFTDDRLRNEDH